MGMEIVREPYLALLRTEMAELKRLVDGEPDDIVITRAWTSLDKIKDALSQLCPNHPQILMHR